MQLFTREQILFARRVHVQSERAVKTRLKGEGERKVSIELFSFRHLLNLISELPPAPDRGVMGGGEGPEGEEERGMRTDTSRKR